MKCTQKKVNINTYTYLHTKGHHRDKALKAGRNNSGNVTLLHTVFNDVAFSLRNNPATNYPPVHEMKPFAPEVTNTRTFIVKGKRKVPVCALQSEAM